MQIVSYYSTATSVLDIITKIHMQPFSVFANTSHLKENTRLLPHQLKALHRRHGILH